MPARFRDRLDAGEWLASKLRHLAGPNLAVLGLARGGVPVAYAVARALGAPLDVFVVRKLGVPGFEELAMGAIASGGVTVLDAETTRGHGVAQEAIAEVVDRERREVARRERAYRGGLPALDVRGRVVVVVDDGLATGSSMRAAVAALRRQHPARIVVAVPVAPADACEALRAVADEVVCAEVPVGFSSVSEWYEEFEQVEDDEVQALLGLVRDHSGEPTGAP